MKYYLKLEDSFLICPTRAGSLSKLKGAENFLIFLIVFMKYLNV